MPFSKSNSIMSPSWILVILPSKIDSGVKWIALGTLPDAKKPSGTIPMFLANTQGASIAVNYPDIYDQFQMHSAALLYKLQELDMAAGGVSFKQSDYVLNVQGQKVPTYTTKKSKLP